ncbi:hypothetical protein [Robinsoniella sp. KNHs210]|uniref:hypothetical protein n=1 Tax=Robinsoniella sp. KNHs210 TaxID=1469950 RepID=UPI0012DF73BC|nr:hypothetical protein [Robinsoniella sp. KNHs210]
MKGNYEYDFAIIDKEFSEGMKEAATLTVMESAAAVILLHMRLYINMPKEKIC